MNARTTLGACLVLAAVLAGATFLDRAQRLVPVYAAARDLPAGTALDRSDLVVVRVRLPATALRHYLQPTPGQAVAGRVLAAPLRRETLVPAELLLTSSQHAGLVELPVRADPGDLPEGLRPGDQVQVLAAWTEGARRGRAEVLLPAAEVVAVLQDAGGLTGGDRPTGVQLRMPGARVPAVAAAIATARIFVVKVPTAQPTDPTQPPGEPPASDPGPPPDQTTAELPPTTVVP
jgi:Flp pilus assembly protein CpaB